MWGGVYLFTAFPEDIYGKIIILALEGLLSGVIGHALKLQKWWFFINFVFPGAIALAMQWPLPGWAYFIVFILIWLVFRNSVIDRVPLYLSNRKTWQAIQQLISEQNKTGNKRFIDFGSGLGGTLFYLAERNPDMEFEGIESAIFPFVISRIRCLTRRILASDHNPVRIRYGDFRQIDLSKFDVLYCFLSPHPMTEVYNKAIREMPVGSLMISNSFAVVDIPADKIIKVDDRRQTRLLVWKMPPSGNQI